MRTIACRDIAATVAELFQQANWDLPQEVCTALQTALAQETEELPRTVLQTLLENATIAREQRLAMCQDCGLAVVFVELGYECHLDGDLYEAVDAGVREAYAKGYLRKSLLADPLDRSSNTGDNTPAIVHVKLVGGDRVRLHCAPKGGGSENMSALWMLSPSAGREGVIARIVEHVAAAGGKPCPPLVLGVGLGGNFEKAALLAKEALLRPLGQPSPLKEIADLEQEILQRVNATGVGPMGLGGRTTALAVHVERHPCHLASLPLALNVQCHAARHKSAVI
ncbi:MAG: fumarate hydratase [Armatimonadetes bacterium]|nr:fumarate hydratase [Armatimonadota bacterium]